VYLCMGVLFTYVHMKGLHIYLHPPTYFVIRGHTDLPFPKSISHMQKGLA
jgi:hypothetical protein